MSQKKYQKNSRESLLRLSTTLRVLHRSHGSTPFCPTLWVPMQASSPTPALGFGGSGWAGKMYLCSFKRDKPYTMIRFVYTYTDIYLIERPLRAKMLKSLGWLARVERHRLHLGRPRYTTRGRCVHSLEFLMTIKHKRHEFRTGLARMLWTRSTFTTTGGRRSSEWVNNVVCRGDIRQFCKGGKYYRP
jgi:hypothetical protein